MMSVTILIADDNQVFRAEMKRLLGGEPQVTVAEAGDGEGALRLAQELRPEVVLMDIVMPRMDGLEATRRIKAVQPETKVIILTIHDEEPYRKAARESGADAFLLKKTVMAEIIPTLRVLVPTVPVKPKDGS